MRITTKLAESNFGIVMSDLRSLKPVLPILLGAAIMLSLALGIRQSIGIFLTPLTKDLALSVSQFTMAIAVQNVDRNLGFSHTVNSCVW